MDTRTFFLVGLVIVSYFMWQAWEEDYARPQLPIGQQMSMESDQAAAERADVAEAAADLLSTRSDAEPAAAGTESTAAEPAAASAVDARQQKVVIESDLLRLHLNEKGGGIDSVELLAYPKSLDDDEPTRLLNDQGPRFFIAESGLAAAENGVAPDHTAAFRFVEGEHKLGERDDKIEAVFEWQSAGISVRKVYTLNRGSYAIGVRQEIRNDSDSEWVAQPYYRLQRTALPSPSGFISNPELYSFAGAAVYSPEEKFEKLPLGDFPDLIAENFKRSASGGWLAMLQHYYVAAWIPPAEQLVDYSVATVNADQLRYLARARTPTERIAAGASSTVQMRLYVGPKLQDLLPEVATGLDLTVDYGIFTPISKPLFWLLEVLHDLVRNWGVAIILLTLIVKAIFFKLSEAQYRSMAKMRKIQPRLETLKERYGDDRQKLAMAQMEMFKKEKINPMGGCLPILVQIPVFISLYWVILESVELRQAPFFGWINDLSVKDPFYILPVLNGLTMFATQRLSPTPGMDPVQRKVMQALPVLFAVMFAFFPSGLVLYWTTNGVLSLAQQWYIMRKVDGPKEKTKANAET